MTVWRLEERRQAGTLALCPHMKCGYRCCDFKQTGEILLYPGELADAVANGKSLNHLQIIDANYVGGARAKCVARQTATCDAGYKPLDCKSYPLFPRVAASDAGPQRRALDLTKGLGCPISADLLSAHGQHVRATWAALVDSRRAVEQWLVDVWGDGDEADDVERFAPI
jgi:hypothetical protein